MHYRSTYLDKLHTRDAQNKHRDIKVFPELDNLSLTDIEVYGFHREEVEERERVSWEKVEEMLQGTKI